MKGLETLTRNFRRRLTSVLTNLSAKRKSCCLLRTLSNFVALCATRLCYSRMADRSILAISTKLSNDMHMGLARCELSRALSVDGGLTKTGDHTSVQRHWGSGVRISSGAPPILLAAHRLFS